MSRLHLILFSTILLFNATIGSSKAKTITVEEYFLEVLTLMADETLNAYNSEDHTAFYKYFSKDMSDMVSENQFKALYLDVYKKNLGDIKRKNIISRKILSYSSFPVLTYEAKFEKHSSVIITINFTKEDNNYRITHVKFDRIYSEY